MTPEITSATAFTVDEGTTAVETLTAEDQDSGAAGLAWSKAGGADAGRFTLSSGGELAFAAAPDYENPDDADGDRTYEITVQVSDGDNTDTEDLSVTVGNVVELAAEVSGPVAVPYAENGAVRVATYIASSPEDNGDVAWSLSGADSSGFSIDGGALRFLSLPDFESPSDMGTDNMYSLTVAASDGVANVTKDVTVNVTDRDEAGALTLSSTVPRLGTPLTADVTDPDVVTGTTRWIWERSSGRDRVERHQRGRVEQLHAGGRRRGALPAGNGDLYRPLFRRQAGPGGATQRRPGAYAEPARGHNDLFEIDVPHV